MISIKKDIWLQKFIIAASRIIKLVIGILAGIVLILVHYASNDSIENWRVGLTHSPPFIITLELTISTIHPIPRRQLHTIIHISQRMLYLAYQVSRIVSVA